MTSVKGLQGDTGDTGDALTPEINLSLEIGTRHGRIGSLGALPQCAPVDDFKVFLPCFTPARFSVNTSRGPLPQLVFCLRPSVEALGEIKPVMPGDNLGILILEMCPMRISST